MVRDVGCLYVVGRNAVSTVQNCYSSLNVRRKSSLIILTLLLAQIFLAACTPNTPRSVSNHRFVLLDPDRTPQGSIDDRDNRLLIVDSDGNIYTMDPDGRRRQAVTTNASSTIIYQQPTWAPDSGRIAWTQVRSEDDRLKPSLMIGKPDGTIIDTVNLPFAPFYIYWSPDSERLAYLSNWLIQNSPSMALRLVELSGEEATTSTIAQGQPFYFSWAPNGRELLSHVGNELVTLFTIDGEENPLSGASTGFPSPQWIEGSDRFLFAVDDLNGQGHLVMTDRTMADLEELTTYIGSISFSLNPSASKLAYINSDREGAAAAMGPLYIQDMETNKTIEISFEPVLAFFWSPDGQKLAYMQFEIENSRTSLRWKVWEDGNVTAYDTITPSRVFLRRYLAFFDQYAQSMRIWSPNSDAFVYAGMNERGQRGIFVQQLDEKGATRVSSGVFAAWSPR